MRSETQTEEMLYAVTLNVTSALLSHIFFDANFMLAGSLFYQTTIDHHFLSVR
jgi:hypothetical protein